MLNLMRKIPNPPRGFRVAFIAILLTTIVSALRLAFHLGYFYHLFKCAPSLRLTCFLTMEGSHILVATFALAISALGLWSRRPVGFLLSLLALVWLTEIYREWYVATLSGMQMFGVPNFSQLQDQQQYLLPLEGAAWWDIVVLVVALTIFIWQGVMLKRILKPIVMTSENHPTAESGGVWNRGLGEDVKWPMKTKALGITLITLVAILAIAETTIHSQRLANDKLAAATPMEKTPMPMTNSGNFDSTNETLFAGQWWKVATPQEQIGFINGYYDCYRHDAKARNTAKGSVVEFQKAVNNFYETHQDQLRTSVPAVLRDLAVTYKSRRARLPNAEVWREPHGYYDGVWWKQSEPKEQIGYLEGYVRCYSHDVRRPLARFSKPAAKYQELITHYYSHPTHSEDEKIAYVLQRFRDKRSVR